MKQPTVVVHVRIPAYIYDGYCRVALAHDRPVVDVLRDALQSHLKRA